MEPIFKFLLKKYTKTEKQRIEVMRLMDDKVKQEYNEQTLYGNVYNYFIEFAMANPFIVREALLRDKKSLAVLKSGITKAFDESIEYIQKEM